MLNFNTIIWLPEIPKIVNELVQNQHFKIKLLVTTLFMDRHTRAIILIYILIFSTKYIPSKFLIKTLMEIIEGC